MIPTFKLSLWGPYAFFSRPELKAVMTTFVKASLNCGQVRGPVQLGFARSQDPVFSQEVTVTRGPLPQRGTRP